MTSTEALIEFLRARIAEDEWIARTTAERTVHHPPSTIGGVGALGIVGYPVARVLAECEAKRQIVLIHHPHDHHGEHGDAVFCDECQWDHADDSPRIDNQSVENFGANPCRTLAVLALPYADHADFDEAWRT